MKCLLNLLPNVMFVNKMRNYSHLPNRFYESISCGSISVFDKTCFKNVSLSEQNENECIFIESLDDAISVNHKNFDLVKAHMISLDAKNQCLKSVLSFLKSNV